MKASLVHSTATRRDARLPPLVLPLNSSRVLSVPCGFHLLCSFRELALSLEHMVFSRPKRRTYSEDEMYEYAVGALARRMRTVAELKRLMRARIEEPESEYAQTLVELVIRRLKDQGYLNDSQYAAYYSSLRRDNLKLGRMRVITELKTRGVHGSVIDKAVEAAYDGVSDEKQAREYLRKKRVEKPKDQKQAARLFRQLARAGFTTKTIFTILKKWDVDDETLSALSEESETAG